MRDLLVTPKPSGRLTDWFCFLPEPPGILILKKRDIRLQGILVFTLHLLGVFFLCGDFW